MPEPPQKRFDSRLDPGVVPQPQPPEHVVIPSAAEAGSVDHVASIPRVDENSPIGRKWHAVGGAALLGIATDNAMTLADGMGQLQEFENGAIFWSPAFGAVLIERAIVDKWASPSVTQGLASTNETLQDDLGYPVADSFHTGEGGVGAYFERGAIVVRPGGGAFCLHGMIYAHYRSLGDLAARVPVIGLPVADEEGAANGGRVSRCDGGDIWWHPATGAFEVHGAIRARWLALGGPASGLGYPLSDEMPVLRGTDEIGRFNRFERGEIFWSPATPACEVYGAISAKWKQAGGPAGPLGFPLTGETDTPHSGGRYNDFQHGVIVWHGGGPLAGAFAVQRLALYVDSLEYNGHYKVQVNITSSRGPENHGEWGEFDGGHSMQQTVLGPFDDVRADLVINAWLNGISPNVIGKDDRIGTITKSYSIDNLWGLRDPVGPTHVDSFTATLRCVPVGTPIPDDPGHFRTTLFWPFDNFSTGKLSWEEYSATFRDVNEQDKQISLNPLDFRVHPFEIAFYELVYNSLAAGGNCFGMCLLSIEARLSRSIFAEPIYDSDFNSYRRDGGQPDEHAAGDAGVVHEINVRHGYQLGERTVEWFLGQWSAGALHDPVRAFRESRDQYARGDFPLLSVSDRDKFSQKGHAVVPYEWIGDDPAHPDQWIIKVANPNSPTKADDDPTNLIFIDPHRNAFRFPFSTSEVWTGDGSSGGRLISIPYSVLNCQPELPGSSVLSLITGGVVLVVAGASTAQITDGNGCTFYADGARGPNLEPATSIPDMCRVPLHASPAPAINVGDAAGRAIAALAPDPEVYYLHREPPHALVSKFRFGGRGADRPGAVAGTVAGVAMGDQGTPVPKHEIRLGDAIAAAEASGVAVTPPPAPAHPVVTGSVVAGARVHEDVSASEVVNPAVAEARAHDLTHTLAAAAGQEYHWAIYSPRMSASVHATGSGGADSIQVRDAGYATQAIALAIPEGGQPKQVTLALAGWWDGPVTEAPWFELRDVGLAAGQSITAQVGDGGRELQLENTGAAATFELRVHVGADTRSMAVRPGVTLAAGASAVIRPADWTPASMPGTPVHMNVLSGPGGPAIRTL